MLVLQEHDLGLDRAAHRRRTLPELAELAEVGQQLTTADTARVTAETEAGDLEREQRKADADVEQVRIRRQKDQQRLDSGVLSSAKDLEHLQSEIGNLDRRIGDLEDAELELMERVEEAQNTAAGLQQQTASLTARRTELETSRDAAFAELDASVGELTSQRTEVAGSLPEALVALYTRQREHHGGIGAAEFSQGRCGGCRMELNPNDARALAALPPDEVARCEECGRILVRPA